MSVSLRFLPLDDRPLLRLPLLAMLALAGCGDDGAPSRSAALVYGRDPARFVRLLDSVATARTTGLEALGAVAAADENAAPLFATVVATGEVAHGARVESPPLWAFLHRENPALSAKPAPIVLLAIPAPRGQALRLTVEPAAARATRAFVIPIRRELEASEFADPAAAEMLVRATSKQLFWAEPSASSPPAQDAALHAWLDEDALITTLVVGLIDGEGARVRLTSQSKIGGLLRRARIAGLPAFVARANAGRDAREAVLLPTGASIEWSLRWPKDGAILRCAVGSFIPGVRGGSEVAATVRAGDDSATATAGSIESTWSPLELDGSRFADRDVVIRFENSRRDDAQVDIVAVAEPRIVLRGVESIVAPDVLLVSLDTLRKDHATIAGTKVSPTPTLDALEAEAVVFDAAISAASWTLPSHAAAFTGLLPDRTGTTTLHGSVPDAVTLLAEDFRAAHYETFAVVAGGFVDTQYGFARGFDRFVNADPVSVVRAGRKAEPAYAKAIARSDAARREVLDWIARPRGAAEAPGFVFLHTYAAHGYGAPDDVRRALGATGADIEAMQNAGAGELHRRLLRAPDARAREQVKRIARLAYAGAAHVADELVRDILDARKLRAGGRPLIVVLFSDHGEQLGEHDTIGHGTLLYDELMRVPLLVLADGLAPRRVPDLVSLVDLAPTLREWCSLDDPASGRLQDGRSLLPLLAGERLPPRPAYARVDDGDTILRMLRTERMKVIVTERAGADTVCEWYDLVADPAELHDLARADAAAAARARDQLERFAAGLARVTGANRSAPLSADKLEEMQQLGYVGDGK